MKPTMKSLLIICCLLLSPLVITAQEGACDINLEDAIANLFQAQRSADSGDTATALANIATVQADLSAISELCSGEGPDLPQRYVASDDGIAFHYPAGWVLDDSLQDNAYIVATSEATLDIMQASNPENMPEGEFLILVWLLRDDGDTGLGEFESFEQVVREFRDELIGGSFGQMSATEAFSLNDQRGLSMTASNTGFLGILDFVDYLNTDTPQVLFVTIFGNPVDEAQMSQLLHAVESSIEIPAQLSATPAIPTEALNYVSATSIRDISEDINFREMALSPDGTTIAYFETDDSDQICLYTLAGGDINCDPVPDEYGGRPPQLLWSPDGHYIAFSIDFFRLFREADLWLYDVENGAVFNRTDDGIDDFRIGDNPESDMWIDQVFTWGADNNLYIYRYTIPAGGSTGDSRQELVRLSPDGGETELIRDFTVDFDIFPVFSNEEIILDGSITVSPDSQHIAFVVREREQDSANNGVWVVDINGDNLRKVMNNRDFQRGVPDSAMEQRFASRMSIGVAWNATSDGLFVLGNNLAFARAGAGYSNVYYVDLSTSQVTVMTDFSDVEGDDLFEIDEETGLSSMFEMPFTATVTPDRNAVLIFNRDFRNGPIGISIVRLTDNGGEQELLYRVDDGDPLPSLIANVASDGTVIMMGYVFETE